MLQTKLKSSILLSSEYGFTLVESMVAAAVAVVVIGGLATQLTSMAKMQNKITLSSTSSSKDQEIGQALKNGKICTDAIVGATFSPTGAVSLTLNNLGMSSGTLTMSAGSTLTEGVVVKSLQLISNTATPSATIPIQSAGVHTGDQKQYDAVIRLKLEKTSTAGISLSVPTDIPVRLLVDGANRVVACNSEASKARACAEKGGMFDPTAPAATACQAYSRCEMRGSFSETVDPVNSYKNGFTGSHSCDPGFIVVRTGTTAHAKRCGKYCIGNDYSNNYTCMKCGPGLATLTPDKDLGLSVTSDYAAEAAAIDAANAAKLSYLNNRYNNANRAATFANDRYSLFRTF